MMKGEQQKIFHNPSVTSRKINAFITLLYQIKFKIGKSRTSTDFIDHLRSIKHYIEKNKIKRFILITDNASFHVSRKTKQFIENQLDWLTVIFLPKRFPNLNPVETRINRNMKMDWK
jgi:transposase